MLAGGSGALPFALAVISLIGGGSAGLAFFSSGARGGLGAAVLFLSETGIGGGPSLCSPIAGWLGLRLARLRPL